jgi:hypothetical protein
MAALGAMAALGVFVLFSAAKSSPGRDDSRAATRTAALLAARSRPNDPSLAAAEREIRMSLRADTPADAAGLADAVNEPSEYSAIASLVDGIETSGEAPGSWLEEVSLLSSVWTQSQALPEGTSLGSWACYAEGCICRVRLGRHEAFGDLVRSVGMSDPFRGWAERATLVGPEPAGEAGEAVWLVVPPTDSSH